MKRDVYIELLKNMLNIRYSEQMLADQYKLQEIRTPVHFGIGQEASAVGVCAALKSDDVIFSHHRCHNHYLAKGGDLQSFISELYGRESGCSNGRGGSVHLTDCSKGVVATSAILGQMLPLAVGAALSFKMDNKQNIAAAFFGDGALDEGVVYESFNYAAINKLPVIFVCENNLYSTETKLDIRAKKNTNFLERAMSFGINSVEIDGNNVLDVYKTSLNLIHGCRDGNGPIFLECKTYRWLEHVGPYYDYELSRSYRTKEEVLAWKEKCPIKIYADYLDKENIISLIDQQFLHQEIERKVRDAILQAQKDPWPNVEEICNNIY